MMRVVCMYVCSNGFGDTQIACIVCFDCFRFEFVSLSLSYLYCTRIIFQYTTSEGDGWCNLLAGVRIAAKRGGLGSCILTQIW